jgi:hypothetical protein
MVNSAYLEDDNMTDREMMQQAECWCHKCNENKLVNNIQFSMTRMILCPTCGNKRCPKASDHRLVCTESNDPNQQGSIYTTPPAAQPAHGDIRALKHRIHELEGEVIGYKRILEGVGTAAQRPWVGLTDEDLEFWTRELGQGELGKGVIRAVGDHLKEKNT